ncbi:AER363Wp [Eremothecium gossypii ATCC 10895]|uniref:Ribonuclease n=1 Tax=Eremothecium gossypii (strain ATCC 10895 / CBS 109.51 / FGSC 9923 / NRRL Y-1056) TaxID=284811 RepID=Q756A4_EREGS|nr:AER363Wp [Eremothecium gossypii ATCC 10895]AAS53043.2 AER363Wp [Eremothecium gossypii ATCC 10895]AEY97351.1 FAER363Wp [Eremothecium gossypii FDAG1]
MSAIPTLPENVHSLDSASYFSPVPELVSNAGEGDAVILGVDEAGRGPVLGPMVYAVAYCTVSYEATIVRQHGFDDSKKLTDAVRRTLFGKICAAELAGIGFATTGLSPAAISSGMLRYPPTKNYNLNEQAHDTTIALIQGVLDAGVRVEHVYVDTVGPPLAYQAKLQQRFPACKITVAKKADSTFPVVSVASVVAKVTRDVWLHALRPTPDDVLGSGYPGDQKTVAWLHRECRPLFGWSPELVRFSWQTCRTLLESDKAIRIEWEEDSLKKKSYASAAAAALLSAGRPRHDPSAVVSLDAWFGH